MYVPRAVAAVSAPGPHEVAKAADQLTKEGHHVRLTRSILIPEDETCFYLFQAQSGDAVREAAERSGLRFERVVDAVSQWQDTTE
jgi:hypothetical protein